MSMWEVLYHALVILRAGFQVDWWRFSAAILMTLLATGRRAVLRRGLAGSAAQEPQLITFQPDMQLASAGAQMLNLLAHTT